MNESKNIQPNLENLADEMGFDMKEYLEVLDVFLDNTPGELFKLKEAIDHERNFAIFDICHLIKGGASSIGMDTISEIAEEMEKISRTKRFDKLREMHRRLQILVVELKEYRKLHY